MAYLRNLMKYAAMKMDYAVNTTWKSYVEGDIAKTGVPRAMFEHLFRGSLTFLHLANEPETADIFGPRGSTILVRKIPYPNTRYFLSNIILFHFVGFTTDYILQISCDVRHIIEKSKVHENDIVVLKDPRNPERYLVRAMAGTEGHATKIGPVGSEGEWFVLKKNTCWVTSAEQFGQLEDAYDSRVFGPVPIRNIVGRAIYYVKIDGSGTSHSHGSVQNSMTSVIEDFPIIDVKLDVDQMKQYHKA